MATLNTFILSTALSETTTIKYKYSHGNNGKENAPQGNVAHTLSILFRLQVLQRTIAEKSMWYVRRAKLVLISLHISFTIIITQWERFGYSQNAWNAYRNSL